MYGSLAVAPATCAHQPPANDDPSEAGHNQAAAAPGAADCDDLISAGGSAAEPAASASWSAAAINENPFFIYMPDRDGQNDAISGV